GGQRRRELLPPCHGSRRLAGTSDRVSHPLYHRRKETRRVRPFDGEIRSRAQRGGRSLHPRRRDVESRRSAQAFRSGGLFHAGVSRGEIRRSRWRKLRPAAREIGKTIKKRGGSFEPPLLQNFTAARPSPLWRGGAAASPRRLFRRLPSWCAGDGVFRPRLRLSRAPRQAAVRRSIPPPDRRGASRS